MPQYPTNWLSTSAPQWSGMAPWVQQDIVSNMAYSNAFFTANGRVVNNTNFPQVEAPVGSTTALFANSALAANFSMNGTMNGTMPNGTAIPSASSASMTGVKGLAVGAVAIAMSAFLAL